MKKLLTFFFVLVCVSNVFAIDLSKSMSFGGLSINYPRKGYEISDKEFSDGMYYFVLDNNNVTGNDYAIVSFHYGKNQITNRSDDMHVFCNERLEICKSSFENNKQIKNFSAKENYIEDNESYSIGIVRFTSSIYGSKIFGQIIIVVTPSNLLILMMQGTKEMYLAEFEEISRTIRMDQIPNLCITDIYQKYDAYIEQSKESNTTVTTSSQTLPSSTPTIAFNSPVDSNIPQNVCTNDKTQDADVIVKNDGSSIKAYRIDYSGDVIYYQLEETEGSAIYRIKKEDVLIIRLSDGTKVDPSANNESSLSLNQNSQPNGFVKQEWTAEDIARIQEKNKNEITTWNSTKYYYSEKCKKGSPDVYLVHQGFKASSQMFDGNLTVGVVTQKYYFDAPAKDYETWKDHYASIYEKTIHSTPCLRIFVMNATDHMIYIDLFNTFYGNKRCSYILYEDKQVTSVSANTVGGGIGIIGGASTSVGSTTYSQNRFVPIPPKGKMLLPVPIDLRKMVIAMFPNDMPLGSSIELSEEDDYMGGFVQVGYKLHENEEEIHSSRLEFYPKQIIHLGKPIFERLTIMYPGLEPRKPANFTYFIVNAGNMFGMELSPYLYY